MTVHRDIGHPRDAWQDDSATNTDALVAKWVSKIDVLEQECYRMLLDEDTGVRTQYEVIAAAIRLSRHPSKLLGLFALQKHQVENVRSVAPLIDELRV